MILLLAVCILCLCPASQSLDYCVVPDAGDCNDCPLLLNASCNTLQYYANNSIFTNNSIFHFIEGEHNLSTVVKVTNVTNLTLVGVGLQQNLNKVQCNNQPHAGFVVRNFANFSVKNLSFYGCNTGYVQIHQERSSFFLSTGSGLTFDCVTISSSFGIIATKLQGHFFISNSTVLYSIENFIEYTDYCTGSSHLFIDNSKFLGGKQGLFSKIACPNVYIIITNSVFSFNTEAIAFHFVVFTGNFIEMSNITISNNILGVTILLVAQCWPSEPHYLMEISNMTNIRNSARALQITDALSPIQSCAAEYITMRDSVITENTLNLDLNGKHCSDDSPPFAQIAFWSVRSQFKTIQVTFDNVSFSNSKCVSVHLLDVLNVTFINCTFENNQMTAIKATGSTLAFGGNNTFRNNSAVSGAGITLLQNSYLDPMTQVNFTFIDNYASDKGGAVYFATGSTLPTEIEECAIKYIAYLKFDFFFINNSAETAGSSVYWITQDNCSVQLANPQVLELDVVPIQSIVSNFHLQNTEFDPSAISSDPTRVCQCQPGHQIPDCSSNFQLISTYPGNNFTLHLAVVGTMDGTVPGIIYAKFPPSSPQASLGDLQGTQLNRFANCNDFTYTVQSSQRSVHLYLTATPYSPILTVSVDLKACPTGFILNNGACKCNHVLIREGVHCFINNQSILRPANTWIGFSTCLDNSSFETGVVFGEYCPHGYCLPHDVYLSADDPDIQCADNRTGVLCGQCVKNYSLTLGRQKCSECSNLYLLLLFPLAASGLVLVAVLFVLNLTVTEGSINGLIFYANIISMSQYFDTSSQLYTFIAWLNLDLGIDTCFYNGMDAYAETWLQLAFPLYLWLIIAAVIVLCNTLPKKLTERGTQNAVKVLATLLLLSYTKLQRILVTIFSFSTLRYPSGAVHYVWLYDANVHFMKGKHIYLFIAGVLVLGLLVLPYTFGLVLFQYLQACSGRRVCRWVNKLKPVFDAYAGPYKDRYRMWTGLLLVIRAVLIIVFSLNITGSPDFNHMVTFIVSLALLFFSTRGIYRKWPCDFLEAFFYAQLGLFSGVAIYASRNNRNVSILCSFSFATTLLVFLLIIGYHGFSTFKKVVCSPRDHETLDPEEEEQLLFSDREGLDRSLVLNHPCNMAGKGD